MPGINDLGFLVTHVGLAHPVPCENRRFTSVQTSFLPVRDEQHRFEPAGSASSRRLVPTPYVPNRFAQLEFAASNSQQSLFSHWINVYLDEAGALALKDWYVGFKAYKPALAQKLQAWVDEAFSAPSEYHRYLYVAAPTAIPDIGPKGDMPALTWKEFVAQSGMSRKTADGLSLLHQRVTARQPYIGTPNPAQTAKEFRQFFDNMNHALKHIYSALRQKPVPEREATLQALSEAGIWCGSRHFEELRNFVSMLKPDLILGGVGEEAALGEQIKSVLHQLRFNILTGLVPKNDPHWHNQFKRELGGVLGVSSASFFDPLAKPMGSEEKNYNIERFFRIYTAEKIIDEVIAQILRRKISLTLVSAALGEMGADESWFDEEGIPTRGALVILLRRQGILEIPANARGFYTPA
ncbi:MAG: hypothetical protein V4534_02705 [Myxococcota bacterium]